jgi:hypothetical protein
MDEIAEVKITKLQQRQQQHQSSIRQQHPSNIRKQATVILPATLAIHGQPPSALNNQRQKNRVEQCFLTKIKSLVEQKPGGKFLMSSDRPLFLSISRCWAFLGEGSGELKKHHKTNAGSGKDPALALFCL